MKRTILVMAAVVLFSAAAHAGPYLSGFFTTTTDSKRVSVGNEVDNKIRFLDGLDLYLTAGYRFDFGLRLEADVLDIQLYVKDRDFSDFFAVSVGVRNIKCAWDIITFHGFTPYIGAGLAGPLGLFYANSNKDFALNVLGLVGASYAVTGNISVHLAYERVFWFDNNGEGVKSSHNGQNLFKLGVMYKF